MEAKTTKCNRISYYGFRSLRVFPLQVLVYLSKYLIFLQISSLTSMKKPKNSLELPSSIRNTRKFANKFMTDTCGGINLQIKQDIICHIAKVKPETSGHYVAQ